MKPYNYKFVLKETGSNQSSLDINNLVNYTALTCGLDKIITTIILTIKPRVVFKRLVQEKQLYH